jgi:hypothetical protein
MKLNVASVKTSVQRPEQYMAELSGQPTLTLEQSERDVPTQLAVETEAYLLPGTVV